MHISKQLLLSQYDWEDIRGSTLHSTMLMKKYLISSESEEESNKLFSEIRNHCTSTWYVEPTNKHSTATDHYYYFSSEHDIAIVEYIK